VRAENSACGDFLQPENSGEGTSAVRGDDGVQ
jgi:hypothetical protein